MTLTPTQRVALMRKRRRDGGMVRVEFYLTPEQAQRVRQFVNQLKKATP